MPIPSLKKTVVLTLLAGALPIWAQAQEPAREPAPSLLSVPFSLLGSPSLPGSPFRKIEIAAGAQQLSNGYGNWRDLTVRGTHQSGAHVWQTELSAKREFGKSGLFLGVADTVTLDPDWFARVSAGAGDGAFYLPRLRLDGSLSKKWLDRRNLVTSVGLGYYRAPDGHTDRAVTLGAVYYFEQPWIVEGGVRFNRSNPGGISTRQQFLAATWGRDRQDLVTLRYGWGREGYQAIAQDVKLVNFKSKEVSVAWRHWLDNQSGFLLGAERYENPSYDRRGITIGWFYQF